MPKTGPSRVEPSPSKKFIRGPERPCLLKALLPQCPDNAFSLGMMASLDIKGDEELAKGESGDANGLVNHDAKGSENEETEGAKGETIPLNEVDEKVSDEETVDKHLILSPTRRIRTKKPLLFEFLEH